MSLELIVSLMNTKAAAVAQQKDLKDETQGSDDEKPEIVATKNENATVLESYFMETIARKAECAEDVLNDPSELKFSGLLQQLAVFAARRENSTVEATDKDASVMATDAVETIAKDAVIKEDVIRRAEAAEKNIPRTVEIITIDEDEVVTRAVSVPKTIPQTVEIITIDEDEVVTRAVSVHKTTIRTEEIITIDEDEVVTRAVSVPKTIPRTVETIDKLETFVRRRDGATAKTSTETTETIVRDEKRTDVRPIVSASAPATRLRCRNRKCTQQVRCLKCRKRSLIEPLQQLETQQTAPSEKLYHCPECDERFCMPDKLLQHCAVHSFIENPLQCRLCDKRLRSSTTYRVHVMSHFGYRQHPCMSCSKTFAFRGALVTHLEAYPSHRRKNSKRHRSAEQSVDRGKKRYRCPYCPHYYDTRDKLNEHCVVHTLKVKGRLECFLCAKQLSDYTMLRRHILRIHFNFKKLSCPYCDKAFILPENLRKHLLSYGNNDSHGFVSCRKRCPSCPQTFRFALALEKHLLTAHSGNYFHCPGCERKYPSLHTFRVHIRKNNRHHERRMCPACTRLFLNVSHPAKMHQGDYNCPECKRTFGDASRLRKHIRWHAHGARYRCKAALCNKSYAKFKGLKRHIWRHYPPNETNVGCSDCSETFPYVGRLQCHIMEKSHDAESPFKRCFYCRKILGCMQNLPPSQELPTTTYDCTVCFKKFTTILGLTQHFDREHSGSNPFQCEICKKGFLLHVDLLFHRKNCHRVSSCFRCYSCGFLNQSYWEMQKHRADHAADRLHFCEECSLGFSSLAVLTSHMQMHERERPFRCKLCRRRFANLHEFERNILEHITMELPNLFQPVDLSFGQGAIHRCRFCSTTTTASDGDEVMARHVLEHVQSTSQPLPRLCNVDSMLTAIQENSLKEFMQSLKKQFILLQAIPPKPTSTVPVVQPISRASVGLQVQQRSTRYDCRMCKQKFTTILSLTQHLAQEHLLSKLPKLQELPMMYDCKMCSQKFTTILSLTQHLEREHSHSGLKPYRCEICQESFILREDLLLHRKNCHRVSSCFRCYSCGYVHQSYWAVHNHRVDHVTKHKQLHFCEECSVGVNSVAELTSHTQMHERERPFRCELCRRRFANHSEFEANVLEHITMELPNLFQPVDLSVGQHAIHRCRFCSTTASGGDEKGGDEMMARHILEHVQCTSQPLPRLCSGGSTLTTTQENSLLEFMETLRKQFILVQAILPKPTSTIPVVLPISRAPVGPQLQELPKIYDCKMCNQKFTTILSGTLHFDREHADHSGSKPFQCEICKQSFLQHVDLLFHRKNCHRVSSGFRCYSCGFLNQSYREMQKHRADHAAARLHFCEECSVGFNSVAELTSHTQMHERERPFRCELCRRRFANHREFEANVLEHITMELPNLFFGSGVGQHAIRRCRFCSATTSDGDEVVARHILEHVQNTPQPLPRLCNADATLTAIQENSVLEFMEILRKQFVVVQAILASPTWTTPPLSSVTLTSVLLARPAVPRQRQSVAPPRVQNIIPTPKRAGSTEFDVTSVFAPSPAILLFPSSMPSCGGPNHSSNIAAFAPIVIQPDEYVALENNNV